jgi:tetratricopeptide (TPR) repeat protein
MTTKKPRRKVDQQAREPTAAPPFDRRRIEEQMTAVTRLFQEREFASVEEANAFLQQMMTAGGLPPAQPRTPLEEAQELIYQALETSGKRREQLARRALAISADCADAYVLLAEATADPQHARQFYEQGVQAGERALGEEVFSEGVGQFWGVIETRPYMRARQGLAHVAWHLGEREAAIAHAQEMLRLNPGDNQGLRYPLVNWLLAVGDDTALEHLLAQYPDEWSAQWAYTALLHTLRGVGP